MERGRSSLSGRHEDVGGGCAVQVEVTKRTFEFCDISFFCFREFVFVGDIGNMEIMLKSQKLGVKVTTLASVLFTILLVFPTATLLFHPKARLLPLFLATSLNFLDIIRKKTDDGLSHLWLEGVRCSWMGVSKGKEVKKDHQ